MVMVAKMTHVQYVVSLFVLDIVFVDKDRTTVELSVYALGNVSSSLIR